MTRLVLLVVATALLAAAPSADASWGPRQQLSTGGVAYAEDVALAGNARGDAVAAWEDRGGIAVAFARRGKAFGRRHYAPGSGDGSAPSVAIDEQGNALVAWSYFDNTEPEQPFARDDGCCFGVQLSVRSARTGHFRRRQTLTPIGRDLSAPAFAIRDGRIGFAWSQDYEQRIYARFGRKGHRLGRAVHVHGGQYPVGLALLKSGPAVTYLGAGESRVRLRQFRVRHGRAGHTRPVSPLFSYEADLGVATNARGAQALAWSRELGSTAPVYAGVRSAGGRFHVRRISRQTPAFAPLVAIARSGAALVAWNTPSDKIFAVSRRPGQRFGLARRFGSLPRGARVSDLQIAVDSLGRAVIGWVQSSPGRDEHAFGGFRTAAGRLLQRHDLGRADNLGNQGTAAFDAHGRARLIWRRAAAVSAVRARFP